MTVRYTARRAAQIITVSEYSRRDISSTYKIPAERITVTPEAAPPHFARVTNGNEIKRVRESYGIGRNYILSLGSIQPRKNLVRLIEAYTSLRRERPAGEFPQLVLAGKRGWLEGETLRAAERDSLDRDILFTGYVPERELPALYSGAICFVYPSYFEGFGLPLVEAMQCGVPVVAGNRTSIPEVVNDAAVLVDPFDKSELAAAIARVIDRPEYRAQLIVKGLNRAKTFNWTTTARLTLQVYERAAQKSGNTTSS
jgi:glycosyltransferase involved in cell wall biosynthesis